MKENNNNKILGLVTGIIGLVLVVISFFVFGWLSLIGLTLGIIALCSKSESTAVTVLGVIDIIAGIIFAIMYFVALAQLLG